MNPKARARRILFRSWILLSVAWFAVCAIQAANRWESRSSIENRFEEIIERKFFSDPSVSLESRPRAATEESVLAWYERRNKIWETQGGKAYHDQYMRVCFSGRTDKLVNSAAWALGAPAAVMAAGWILWLLGSWLLSTKTRGATTGVPAK